MPEKPNTEKRTKMIVPCSASCLKSLIVNIELLVRGDGNVTDVVVSAVFERHHRINQPPRTEKIKKWFGFRDVDKTRTEYMWAKKKLSRPLMLPVGEYTGVWLRWMTRKEQGKDNKTTGPILQVIQHRAAT